MPNSSHMVPSLIFLPFFSFIFTSTHTHHRSNLGAPTARSVVYKHRQRHTFTCIRERTPSPSAPAWLYLPQSVSQCWILLIQTAVTATSALGATPDRHHAQPRRHYALCVCVCGLGGWVHDVSEHASEV